MNLSVARALLSPSECDLVESALSALTRLEQAGLISRARLDAFIDELAEEVADQCFATKLSAQLTARA